jgi:hypothetical protein
MCRGRVRETYQRMVITKGAIEMEFKFKQILENDERKLLLVEATEIPETKELPERYIHDSYFGTSWIYRNECPPYEIHIADNKYSYQFFVGKAYDLETVRKAMVIAERAAKRLNKINKVLNETWNKEIVYEF